MENEAPIPNKPLTKTLLFGIGLLALFDFLFWRAKGFGITFGLFGSAVLGTLIAFDPSRFREKSFRLAAILIGGLIVSALIEPKPLSVIMMASCLLLLGVALRSDRAIQIQELFSLLETSIRRGIWQVFRDRVEIFDSFTTGRFHGLRKWKGVGASIIFGLVAVLFLMLFTMANPILDKWLNGFWTKIGDWIWSFLENMSIGRFFFWLLSFAGIWAYLRFKPLGKWNSDIPARLGDLEEKAPVQVVVFFLGLFNVIFLAQNVLDIAFLWGGLALPTGMTHAEYAHRGAYPLVGTALLAILFVLVIFRDQGSSEKDVWAKRLVYIWLGQNLFLLGSACWRLILYIEAFNLTLLRAASIVWLLTVAATFILVIWRLRYQKTTEWLMGSFVTLTIVVLFTSSLINFNGLIAYYNVRHCNEFSKKEGSPRLDIAYLEELGPESLPALRWLKDQNLEPSYRDFVASRTQQLEETLERHLKYDWRGWTLRRGAL